MRARAVARLQGETDLRQAIETRAFEVHYQPIVAFDTGLIAGFEALLRWRHPVRGLVSPAEFIPIAEDTGMILDIGRFALAESCRQMAAWQVRFGAAAPPVMCVNISSRQLADGDLLGEIAAILEQTGLAPSQLKLEITETAFISDVPGAHDIVSRAQAMGIEWSLDDFGTGYSSLSYLHQLRVDTVKVDRSFVNLLGRKGRHRRWSARLSRSPTTLAWTSSPRGSRPPNSSRNSSISAVSTRKGITFRNLSTARRPIV